MTVSQTQAPTAPAPRGHVHLRRLLIWAVLIVVIGAAADLLGWDIRGWFSNLWDTITEISAAYVIAGVALKTVQTTLTAYAWYAILRYAYPTASFKVVLACYATSVALNGFLPANIGTFVMLLMFTTIIAGATFSGRARRLRRREDLLHADRRVHLPVPLPLGRRLVRHQVRLRARAAVGDRDPPARRGLPDLPADPRASGRRSSTGGTTPRRAAASSSEPRKYFVRVFAPSLLGWIASLGVMAVFLAAYDIPVSFDTLMRLAGGNSIANVTSVTPGGAGVNQAFNVASLNGITDATTATAYSVAQQLVTTAWNILFAILLVVWVFGWTGGKELVSELLRGREDEGRRAEGRPCRAQRGEAGGEACRVLGS